MEVCVTWHTYQKHLAAHPRAFLRSVQFYRVWFGIPRTMEWNVRRNGCARHVALDNVRRQVFAFPCMVVRNSLGTSRGGTRPRASDRTQQKHTSLSAASRTNECSQPRYLFSVRRAFFPVFFFVLLTTVNQTLNNINHSRDESRCPPPPRMFFVAFFVAC